MAIYTSGDPPDTFQAQRGQETTPCHTELHLPPPPPPRFSTPLPEGLLSVGSVTAKEQMDCLSCTITLQPIDNYHETRLLKEMSTEKVLLALDWSVL